MKTGTFKPITRDPQVLLAELSRNAERACRKLRRDHCIAHDLYFYIKTQKFTYRSGQARLELPTSDPMTVMNEIQRLFPKIYSEHYDYRATGVVFRSITLATKFQPDLFGFNIPVEDKGIIFNVIDALSRKFGKGTVMLARSLLAPRNRKINPTSLKLRRTGNRQPHIGLIFDIPCWGEAM
jgi:hypothetical protein